MVYPVRDVVRPAVLTGQSNGRLPLSILVDTAGLAGGVRVRLVAPAARAWRALTGAALAAGHTLKATSAADSYRPYEVQESTFRSRYTTTYLAGRPYKTWLGQRWYQLPNTAMAAVPGTSNHGWGLAVDTGEERDSDTAPEPLDTPTLDWLLANEERFGWSHELQLEPWHLRYWAGDNIPPAVLSYEEYEMLTAREIIGANVAPSNVPALGLGNVVWQGRAAAMDAADGVRVLLAEAAADRTRDAGMLAAIQALADAGGVDAAPIVTAVREEAARTREIVTALQATIAEQAAEIDRLRDALAAGARAEADALATPAA